jgi:hypothetical protein
MFVSSLQLGNRSWWDIGVLFLTNIGIGRYRTECGLFGSSNKLAISTMLMQCLLMGKPAGA